MRYSVAAIALGMFAFFNAEQANAQAGIRIVREATPAGGIGSGSRQQYDVFCPDGTILVGVEHAERTAFMDAIAIEGMSTRVGVFCSRINFTETSFNMVRTFTGVTPNVRSPNQIPGFNAYPVDNPRSKICSGNEVVFNGGGYARYILNSSNQIESNWPSAIYIKCGELVFSDDTSGNWFVIRPPTEPLSVVGIVETRTNVIRHDQYGDYCGDQPNRFIAGFVARPGGGGLDQLNFHCGILSQARFSSYITFNDYAWDRTIGSNGWLVNLNQATTLLSGNGASGANKRPHVSAEANNKNKYEAASEIFVFPNDNYRATVARRPAEVTTALNSSAIISGNCTTGISLANLKDEACELIVSGRPDVEVTVVNPPTFRTLNVSQNLTINLRNLGPGSVRSTDRFAVTTTLPSGWGAGDLPENCTVSGQVVRCTLPDLIGSSAPNTAGGTAQILVPIRPTTATNGGYNVGVALDASQVNVSSNPAKSDYNNTNNTATIRIDLLRNANLTVEKNWVNAVVNDKAVIKATSATMGEVVFEATATQDNQVNTSGVLGLVPGQTYTLSEVFPAANVGAYRAGNFSCTGGQLSGTTLTVRSQDTGATISCRITNTRITTDVSVQKSLVTTPANVRPDTDIVWRIVVANSAGSEANGTVLRDVMGEGYDCSAVPPSCTATGGASCPANITAQSLADGVTITQFPASSSLTLDVTCRVTSSGRTGGD